MEGVMVGGVVGDQQGAMLGQGCVSTGSMKVIYFYFYFYFYFYWFF